MFVCDWMVYITLDLKENQRSGPDTGRQTNLSRNSYIVIHTVLPYHSWFHIQVLLFLFFSKFCSCMQNLTSFVNVVLHCWNWVCNLSFCTTSNTFSKSTNHWFILFCFHHSEYLQATVVAWELISTTFNFQVMDSNWIIQCGNHQTVLPGSLN
jgi:hypothetical protein